MPEHLEIVEIFSKQASKAIEQYQGTALQQPLELAFQKCMGQLDGSDRFTLQNLDEVLSFRPFGPEDADLKLFELITSAIRERRGLQFEYRKPGEKAAERRRIFPYHLMQFNNRWYLLAHDSRAKDIRKFVLGRMRDAQKTAEKFTVPKSFDAKKFFDRSREEGEVRDQEEVDDVEGGARAEIEKHDVDVERPHLVEHAHLLGVLDVGGAQEVGGPAHQAEARHRGLDQHVLDALDPALDEVAERALGRGQAEAGVQVRSTQVGVDEHDALAHPRELPAERSREQGLADPTLAPADRPDLSLQTRYDDGCRQGHGHQRALTRGKIGGRLTTRSLTFSRSINGLEKLAYLM